MTDEELAAIIEEREACGGCPQCPPIPGNEVVMEYLPDGKEESR